MENNAAPIDPTVRYPATFDEKGPLRRVQPDLPRRIGFWGGSAVMVGVIIGGGIFRSPPQLAAAFGSPWVILILWAVGGLIALAGALTYAELATMYPQSGGVYVFLREGFGDLVAFVFGWSYMVLIKPFAAGGIAIVFAEHLNQLLHPSLHFTIDPRITTCGVFIVLTAINTLNVNVGARVAMIFTTLKVAVLAGIVVLALAGGHGDAANYAVSPVNVPWYLALSIALANIVWTYDGWSDIGAIAGEVREPQKMLPRIFIAGTLGVTVLYVAVNAVYMWIVSLPEMRGMDTIAPLVMQRLVGDAGRTIVILIVMASTLGATHSSIITGARVTFAQARDGLLFRFLGAIHPRFGTPAVSLWVQCLMSCIAVCALGGFSELIGGFVFTMWIFYGLAAASVFVLRVRRPEALRLYRCPGYPIVPALFVASAVVMTGLSIAENPRMNLMWIAVLVCGAPLYFIWRAVERRTRRN